MTYGDVKREALRLAFQDTIAGAQIPESYNNQADYTGQIPGLVDSAQMDIVIRAKKISAVTPLPSLAMTMENTFRVYTLPDDCQEIMQGGLVQMQDNGYGDMLVRRYGGYRAVGKALFVPKSAPREMGLEYWRYPESVGTNPTDCQQLDNTADTHSAIPYFVAAQLVMYDDAFRYQANYVGEVPGATAVNCGNYILHDLAMAKWEAKAFLKRPWKFTYPKARRIVAKGKTFFDA